ncbi:hypothetical protein [Deinococcus radiophilus]|uniref:Uncharacterized protein n=1 Tax=Deinococcus radiophilus TaxID=32062 RepID=A0A3S0KF35_9DEIO|nr:hypothetical protein [Deinococcus radiophilus]RTR29397.1 hypothetical protein EJ104_03125 [Deinococcus radiophilus]UFA50775.1 hypothetical protein LMT64_02380 [Deinococcus radiophilus]
MAALALSLLALLLAWVGEGVLGDVRFVWAACGLLALLLGWSVHRAGHSFGGALLWVGWVAALIQWLWAFSAQPSGLPYWLVGLALGALGAWVARPDPAPGQPEPDGQENAASVTDADLWIAPMTVPARSEIQPPLTPPAPSATSDTLWSVPVPQTGLEGAGHRPAWADQTPQAELEESAEPEELTTRATPPLSAPSDSTGWVTVVPHTADLVTTVTVKPANVQPPAPAPTGAQPQAWSRQTWWEDGDGETDWPDAEAALAAQEADFPAGPRQPTERQEAEKDQFSRSRLHKSGEIEDRE